MSARRQLGALDDFHARAQAAARLDDRRWFDHHTADKWRWRAPRPHELCGAGSPCEPPRPGTVVLVKRVAGLLIRSVHCKPGSAEVLERADHLVHHRPRLRHRGGRELAGCAR